MTCANITLELVGQVKCLLFHICVCIISNEYFLTLQTGPFDVLWLRASVTVSRFCVLPIFHQVLPGDRKFFKGGTFKIVFT